MRNFCLPEEIKVMNYLEKVVYTGYYKYFQIQCSSIDQKVTFDILNTNCKCILNFINGDANKTFCANDFFKHEYTINLFNNKKERYGGASISKKTAKEYDKLFDQVFNALAYTNILEKIKNKRKNEYRIKNIDILNDLANSEEASICFICWHVWYLIKSAGLDSQWNIYLNNENDHNLNLFRNAFESWMISTTKHIKDVMHIFQKIINPLFYLFELKKYNQKNQNCKNLPQSVFNLTYFRVHKRDKNRIYGKTRKEMNNIMDNRNILPHVALNENNQKENVKKWNSIYYDLKDRNYMSELSNTVLMTGIQIHHIWPKNNFDSDSPISPHIHENLIILSSSEHTGKAHKCGNVSKLNENFLSAILWKQYEKIVIFNTKKIGKYDFHMFYKLVCYIKGVDPHNYNSDEILCNYIEQVISL